LLLQKVRENKKMLDEDQVTALNLAKNGHNLLITGQAGCDKTFLVKEIAKQLKTLGKQVRICCSTGMILEA
jgi:ATP-dependent exoDNAse (exonuclease V) alpha subunit